MYHHLFLVRYTGSRFNPELEVDAFISFKEMAGIKTEEQFRVASRINPKLYEKEVHSIKMMGLRMRFDANTDGLFHVNSEVELDREEMQLVLNSWRECGNIEEKLESARMSGG